ncbi:bifunctional folylpolyglutamate synthase/dihydrofolate synthase [Thomasclavelia saccharogumia]|uniref:bifunctional folylpolyglutamate synthase/dihydrofolate synthase n=1 Tax=Thomasclavelia saccharogumia TaxID=341225 RepID=UPI00047BEE58|nr:Mur ligase family protein [Thomasclavelia saccharogumia]
MFDNIKEAVDYIESKRVKRSFEQFQEIVNKYHFNLHQKNMIHVAGTNGKGSTTNFIKEILMKHGYTVGTFTSPYMLVHNDRICINGEMISDSKLLEIINGLINIIEVEKLSMFEIDVLIMLRYFNECDLDYRIIETGIGGLNDKTNVIDSICSVITNIGYDHQFMLGDTLEEIALQKAGIIKTCKPCYIVKQRNQINDIFSDICKVNNSKLHIVEIDNVTEYPYVFNCLDHIYKLENCGSYQINNATLAITVCNDLIELDNDLVQLALDDFSWPGRFERFGNIYLDGAHNIDGILALIQTLKDQKLEDVVIVFCALGDKDVDEMLELLKDYPLIQASFEDERLKSDALDFKDALAKAEKKYKNIVVTGSLHFISAVRKYLKNKKIT